MRITIFVAVLLGGVTLHGQDRDQPPPAGAPKSAYQLEMEKQWKLHPALAIGAPAPDFELPGINGKKHTLADYENSQVLAVMFICNRCLASQLYEERIMKMVADHKARSVQFIAIQPNAVSAITQHELNFTDVDDSLASMIVHAKFKNFNFPYLCDGDTQQIAHLYGPKNTPQIFVFDRDANCATRDASTTRCARTG